MRTEKQKQQCRESASRWYYKNKAKANNYAKAWALEHPERRKEIANKCAKIAYDKVPKKALDRVKAWQKDNRGTLNRAKRNRIAVDPVFKLLELTRTRMWRALKGISKHKPTIFLLGGVEETKKHIENQFRPGMSWENYGPVWHVDHIKPCAKFDLTLPEQQAACFHYSNLQPLFAIENLQKGDKCSA